MTGAFVRFTFDETAFDVGEGPYGEPLRPADVPFPYNLYSNTEPRSGTVYSKPTRTDQEKTTTWKLPL